MSDVDVLMFTLCIVLSLGAVVYAIGQRTGISTVPLLMVIGVVAGPVVGLIDHDLAHRLFEYVRVFGLVVILYTEGHSLQWPLLRRHLATIGLLDTVGLLLTALVSAAFFSWAFGLPYIVGFLFGAIISATDPATLVPLFRENRIDENVETVLVTESIFNDPLGIVLTVLALALLVPQADDARVLEEIAAHITLYPAAVVFFLYQIGGAIVLGIFLGYVAHWSAPPFLKGNVPILVSLAIALGGFAVGEWIQVSGYLVATVIGILFGNQEQFFKGDPELEAVEEATHVAVGFNQTLSDFATLFIFILLGASLELSALGAGLMPALGVALAVVFVARPLALAALLPLRRWSLRQIAFMSLEGPRGVVPSAMAGLLFSVGVSQSDPQLVHWGQAIMTATVVTVFVSVILETLWMRGLNRRLLRDE